MQLYPGFNNYVAVDNIHVFGNFTPGNLNHVKTQINLLETPEIHVFVNQNHIPANLSALIELIQFSGQVRTNYSRAMSVIIYGPMRHPEFKKWFQSWSAENVGPSDQFHVSSCWLVNEFFFPLNRNNFPKERLSVRYLVRHGDSDQLMRFTYDRVETNHVVQEHLADFETVFVL